MYLPFENVESLICMFPLAFFFFYFFFQGKGTTFVVYMDEKLRVFRSDTGGTVVQTKADEVVSV